MTRTSGFVTITALILLVLLGCMALSMAHQARCGLDIARNSRLYTRELALAEAGALKAAARLLKENGTAFVQKCLVQASGLDFENLALSEEQWKANDLGLLPDAFVLCQPVGPSWSDSLDVSAEKIQEFHFFARAKKSPYGPVIRIGVRKVAN